MPDYTPVSYGSLKDLQKGRSTSSQTFTYAPDATRSGYAPEPAGGSGVGAAPSGRRLPPDAPRGPTGPPPRRYDAPGGHASAPAEYADSTPGGAPATAGAGGWGDYATRASGYGTAAGAKAAAYGSAAGERVSDAWSSVATQQRKDQVVGGITKGATTIVGGAFKLAGKGIWEIGKAATK